MKIKTAELKAVSLKLGLLMKLNADCASVHWSKTIDVPTDVMKHLTGIEEWIDSEISKLCTQDVASIPGEEESKLTEIIRLNRDKEIGSKLGNGVLMPSDVGKAISFLNDYKDSIPTVLDALKSVKKKIVVFW